VPTHAPASLPENVVDPVVMCQATYTRFTTHNALHNRKRKGAQQPEHLVAERETEAAGDEIGLSTLRMFYAAHYSVYLLGLINILACTGNPEAHFHVRQSCRST